MASAHRYAVDGMAAAARLGDPPGSNRPYEGFAAVEMFHGRPRSARHFYAEARARAEAAADGLTVGRVLGAEALALAYAGETTAAIELADRAVADAQRSGSPAALSWAAYAAGEARLEVDPAAALPWLDVALTSAEEVDDRMILGVAGLSAITARARLGAPDDFPGYRRLIEHWRHVGAWTQQWTTLRNLAEALCRHGEARAAARLVGAARTSPTAVPAYGAEAARMAEMVATLREGLGDEVESELAAGAVLGDAGAVALALEVLDRL